MRQMKYNNNNAKVRKFTLIKLTNWGSRQVTYFSYVHNHLRTLLAVPNIVSKIAFYEIGQSNITPRNSLYEETACDYAY